MKILNNRRKFVLSLFTFSLICWCIVGVRAHDPPSVCIAKTPYEIITGLNQEFTVCADSLTGHCIPIGAHIHYENGYTTVRTHEGTLFANISDENSAHVLSTNPFGDTLATHSIEVPSDSYVFQEDNGKTIIASDINQSHIITTITDNTTSPFPPTGISDQWVAWREIPINPEHPLTRLHAEWTMGQDPTPLKTTKNYIQSFHIFPGINTGINTDPKEHKGILQPVLSWNHIFITDNQTGHRNKNAKENVWSISSHICGWNKDETNNDIHSESKIVEPYSTITGEVTYKNGWFGNYWEIYTSSGWFGETSKINSGGILSRLNYANVNTNPPPGHDPGVVFAIEKHRALPYPGSTLNGLKVEMKHWPDNIKFSNIIIEPENSVLLDNKIDHGNLYKITCNNWIKPCAAYKDGIVMKLKSNTET